MDGVKKYQLMSCIIFGIACIVYLIVISVFSIETEVMHARFVNADDIFHGNIPSVEYPPFALVFMIIPRFFASTPYWYNVGFTVELFAFFVLGLIIICKLAKLFNKDQKKAMLAYFILMFLMFEFVVDRYDIIPAVLTLLSVYCYMTKRYTWAFILLSLGTMTKLYPAVLFPIFIIPFIVDRKWMEALKGTGVFVLVSLVIVGFAMVLQPDMLSYFIDYHSDRPLQIESVAASFIYPFSMLGLTDVWIEYSFGSDNLMGPWPDAVAAWLTPLMITSILAVYAIYAYMLNRIKKEQKRNESDRVFLFGNAVLLAIMLFIIVGKVFSSQYLIWLIPPILFLLLTMKNSEQKRNLFIIFIIANVLTQLNFIYNVGYLGGGVNINDLGMMIILARNIVMIILLYCSIKAAYGRFRTSTVTTGEDAVKYSSERY